MPLADRLTTTRKKEVIYSDFLTSFDRNPVTGNLATVTNEKSVSQAIRNLILTGVGEKPFKQVGSNIKTILFERVDEINSSLLKDLIRNTIVNYERRVILLSVIVKPDEEKNLYDIKIIYALINNQDQELEMNLMLSRVR
jgi:phage baseplate assembly protein W